MIQQVSYRPFQDGDFDAIAGILLTLWHQDHESAEYNWLETCEDLTRHLAASTFVETAVCGDEPVGAVLACGSARDVAWTARWQEANAACCVRMRALDPVSQANHDRFLALEKGVNDGMAKEAGLLGSARIVLFLVKDELRGQGIGTALFDRALAHLRQEGEPRVYLSTDSCSNWRFYEHRGLTRATIYYAKPDEADVLADEMYLYTMDFVQ